MRRADRCKTDLPIEIYAGGRRHERRALDISRGGMFVRDLPALAEGTLVRVAMVVEGVRHVTAARVAHANDRGAGVAFRAPVSELDAQFADAIGGMVARFAQGTGQHPIVRSQSQSDAVGSTIDSAVTAVIDVRGYRDDKTVVDGVVLDLVDEDPTGAVAKPATAAAASVLRGTFPLPAVFAMLEQERMTGRLAVAPDAWIDFADGRIVHAGTAAEPYAHDFGFSVVLQILDRGRQMFEFRSRHQAAAGIERGLSVTHVLMEHARIADESRPIRH